MAIETYILPLNGKVFKCYSNFVPSHILFMYHFCHGFLKVILMLTLQIFALNHVLCPIFFFIIAYHIRTKQIKRCC